MTIDQFYRTGKEISINIEIGHYYLAIEQNNKLCLQEVIPVEKQPLQPRCKHGTIVLDATSRTAFKDGLEVSLSVTEWNIISYLMKYPNQVVAYPNILQALWGYAFLPENLQYLRVWTSRLRKKLAPKMIETVNGYGLKLLTDGN